MKKEIRYPVIFIAVTLAVSWSFTIVIFSKPERVQFFPFIMLFPAAIGIIMNSIRYRSVSKVFKPVTNRINIRSVLFAFFYPVLFLAITAIVVVLTGFGEFNSDKLSGLALYPSLGTIAFGFLLIFGEEYGWRGFLLKELAATKGKIISAIIVGLVWAVWHGPAVYELAKLTNMENPALISIIQMSAVFVFSFPFAYSYFLTNNILPPMIFHFVWNFYNPLLLGDIYMNKPGIVEGNILYINGESLAGIIVGLPFVFWYIYKNKSRN